MCNLLLTLGASCNKFYQALYAKTVQLTLKAHLHMIPMTFFAVLLSVELAVLTFNGSSSDITDFKPLSLSLSLNIIATFHMLHVHVSLPPSHIHIKVKQNIPPTTNLPHN